MNIFGTKPIATTNTEASAAPVTPVVAEKKSILSSVKSFFVGVQTATREQLHQRRLVPMVSLATQESNFLAQQIPLSLRSTDVKTILGYHHDLNNKPVVDAIASDTFKTLKSLIKDSRIGALMKAGCSMNASKEGGRAHAEEILNVTLLEGMQKGIQKALQGKGLTDDDKRAFLDQAIESSAARLADGSSTPEQVLEEISKISSDAVLGSEAQQGSAANKLAALKEQAETKIKTAEKLTLLESINAAYQSQNEKLARLDGLFQELRALKNKEDSSVADSVQVSQEVQTITNQILELVKEIDEDSEISAEHIINPLSKNIKKPKETELETLLGHDLDKAELFVKQKTEEINKDLVEKLVAIQNGRSTSQWLYDGIFNRGSDINTTLSTSASNQQRIAILNKKIAKYEATQEAKVKAASARSWTQCGIDMVRAINPFKSTGPSADAQLADATKALEEFLEDETVQSTLRQYETLITNLGKVKAKTYLFTSSRQKAVGQAEGAIENLRTTNMEMFTKFEELIKAKNAADLAVSQAAPTEEATEEDFVVA